MAWSGAHPILEEPVWDRRAGRYDFRRFDHITSTSRRAAYQNIGAVDVDCRFHFKDSRWGTLGKAKIDAGIIYMEINFNQPPGHKLEWARIQLTLDEEDPRLGFIKEDEKGPKDVPLHITDYYGPQRIVGPPKLAQVQRSLELEPFVEYSGIGLSLGKYASTKQFERESRWTFRSCKVQSRDPWKRRSDTILRWELFESDFEKCPVLKNQVFTAFTYEYCGQPFLMKVEITGRLAKLRDRMKEARHRVKDAMKFGPRIGKDEDVATTLIRPYHGKKVPLDERAMALEMELVRKNLGASAREFQDVTNSPPPKSTNNGRDKTPELSGTPRTGLADGSPDPLLEELAIVATGAKVPVSHKSTSRVESSGEDRSQLADRVSSKDVLDDQVENGDAREVTKGSNLAMATISFDFITYCWGFLVYLMGFLKAGDIQKRVYSDSSLDH